MTVHRRPHCHSGGRLILSTAAGLPAATDH